MSVDDASLYRLFTAEVLELMRTLIAPDRQSRVAVVLRARKA